MFTVNNINVVGAGENATEARSVGIASGETEAFEILLKRITPSFVHHALPAVEAQNISSMVLGMEIKNEKVTSNHYRALVNISFNPNSIKNLLKDSGIAFIEKQSDPVLIVPLASSNATDNQTELTDMWLQAWKQIQDNSALVDYKVAATDEAVTYLSAYINNNSAALGNLADPMVAQAQIDYLKQKYHVGSVMGALIYPLPSQANQPIISHLISLDNIQSQPQRLAFSAKPNDTPINAQLVELATAIDDYITRNWKRSVTERKSNNLKITVTVPIEHLVFWNELKKQLATINTIERMSVEQVNVHYAIVQLHFNASYETLVKQLAKSSLYLENTGQGIMLTQQNQPPQWFIQQYQKDDTYDNFFEG